MTEKSYFKNVQVMTSKKDFKLYYKSKGRREVEHPGLCLDGSVNSSI